MSNPNIHLENPGSLPVPLSAYSHLGITGNLVFVSGQLPLSVSDGRTLVDLDAAEQTRVVLNYVREALQSLEMNFEDIVKTTLYVADLRDYAQINDVYAEVFGNHRPARATIQAGALIGGASVEIEAIAVRHQ